MKKAMKQSTITRILSLLAAAMLIVTAVAVGYTGVMAGKLTQAADARYILVTSANNFKAASNFLTDQVRKYAIEGDQAFYDNYWKEVNEDKNRDIALETMFEAGLTDEEQALMTKIGDISNGLIPLEEKAMECVQAGDLAAAVDIVYGEEYEAGVTEISNTTEVFFEKLTTRSNATIEKYERKVLVNTGIAVACVAGIFVVQLIIIIFMTKKILNPIKKIQDNMVLVSKGDLTQPLELEENTSEIGTLVWAIKDTKHFLKEMIEDIKSQLQKMADGDFDFEIEEDYVGEFVEIKETFYAIMGSLSDTLQRINNAADQVASGSGQVSSSAQVLSQGAAEQASSIQELSLSIGEISQQIKENAESTVEANVLTRQAGEALESGSKRMGEMMEAMSDITEKSNEISKIIKTIDDIAFQTNILALNAAVEAARAGEAGKGFAVVADEVRSLAQKSADAAKGTTELIENTVIAVSHGTKIADETVSALDDVVKSAGAVVDIIEQISQSSGRQAEAAAQVSSGVEQISSVVQSNSATAEESAAASEELSGQANMLKELTARFKLHS